MAVESTSGTKKIGNPNILQTGTFQIKLGSLSVDAFLSLLPFVPIPAMNVTVPCSKGMPDSNVHGANMGLTGVLSAPDGPHVGPMNLNFKDGISRNTTAVNFVISTAFEIAWVI